MFCIKLSPCQCKRPICRWGRPFPAFHLIECWGTPGSLLQLHPDPWAALRWAPRTAWPPRPLCRHKLMHIHMEEHPIWSSVGGGGKTMQHSKSWSVGTLTQLQSPVTCGLQRPSAAPLTPHARPRPSKSSQRRHDGTLSWLGKGCTPWPGRLSCCCPQSDGGRMKSSPGCDSLQLSVCSLDV